MQQLPLNGRNYLQLLPCSLPVPSSQNKDWSLPHLEIEGCRTSKSPDGGLNNPLSAASTITSGMMRPSLEAIQEFKVQTGNFGRVRQFSRRCRQRGDQERD